MPTVRSRRNPPGTRNRTYKSGVGNLRRTVSSNISGTLLNNAGVKVVATPVDAQVTIEVNRTEAVAPAGFYFVAHASGFVAPAGTGPFSDELAHYTDLRYKWDFGEEGKVYDRMQDGENFIWDRVFNIDGERVKWNKPGHPADDPAYEGSTIEFVGIDKNKAFGPHTGIVYAPTQAEFDAEFAATGNAYIEKTIQLEVLSKPMANAGDAPVVQTATVRVHDPEAFFGDANTFYVSPSGSFPAGAANTYTSLNAAMKAFGNRDKVRVLFNRNEVHDTTLMDATWSRPENFAETQFGAYGPGIADPVIRGTGLSPRAKKGIMAHASTWGLRFQGDYEPAEPWVNPGSWNEEGYTIGQYANSSTVWDCHFEGLKVPLAGSKDMENVCVGNCRINKWWNYGFYSNIGVTRVNFSGVSIMQEWDAIITNQADYKHDVYYDVHGPWRISHAGRIGEVTGYVSHSACYLRSMGGWTVGPQPCIRLGGNGFDDEPMLMRTSQDRIFNLMGMSLQSGTFKGPLYPHMEVWDKVVSLQIDATGDGSLVSIGCSGVVARNALSIVANTARLPGPGVHSVVLKAQTPRDPQDPSLFVYPVKTQNILAVDLRDDDIFNESKNNPSFAMSDFETPGFSEWIDTDSIKHTPVRSAATTDHDITNEPLMALEQRAGLDYPGLRHDPNPPMKWTEEALIPRTVLPLAGTATSQRLMLYVPQPGSPAYQTGDPNNSAIDDLYGNIRPAETPSKGPIEPASL